MKKIAKTSAVSVLEHKVIVQKWEESERGWGTRPDGFTMHLTDAHRKAYIDAYWDRMPDWVPDEYSCPSGEPYEAYVDTETYNVVKASGNGTWGNGNNYPGSGGTDGWMKIQNLTLKRST